jgi:hypothetical protein
VANKVLHTTCFQAGLLLGLFFDVEDVGDIFFLNVDRILAHCTALYPRKYNSF